MVTTNIHLFPETLRSIDASTFTGSYQALGTPFANPIVCLKLYNGTSVAVTFTIDPSRDVDILPSNGFFILDIGTNKQLAQAAAIAAGTQWYVKGAAGTGAFYLSVWYLR